MLSPVSEAVMDCVVLGELVQTTDGKWITRPRSPLPERAPASPESSPGGHVACLGYGGGEHTTWHCRTCDAVIYGPPLNTHCTALEGRAAVQISTARD